MKKAVVFIDVQNDFVKGGALAYGYPAEDIVPKIAAFAAKCRERGDSLYATRDTHDADYLDTLEGKKLPVPHCNKDLRGWDIADALDEVFVRSCVKYVNKPTFGSTKLVEKLIPEVAGGWIDEIILCGFCTSICVVSNALLLRAALPNTKITLLEDLCGDIDEASHKAALAVLRNCQIDIATSDAA